MCVLHTARKRPPIIEANTEDLEQRKLFMCGEHVLPVVVAIFIPILTETCVCKHDGNVHWFEETKEHILVPCG